MRQGDTLFAAVAELGRRHRDDGRPMPPAPASVRAGLSSRTATSTSPEEFVNLITAQRGFQANSRVITTTDEILAELVNIVR